MFRTQTQFFFRVVICYFHLMNSFTVIAVWFSRAATTLNHIEWIDWMPLNGMSACWSDGEKKNAMGFVFETNKQRQPNTNKKKRKL